MNLNLCALFKTVLNIYPLIQLNGTESLNIMHWQEARSTLLIILDFLITIWKKVLSVTSSPPAFDSLKKCAPKLKMSLSLPLYS